MADRVPEGAVLAIDGGRRWRIPAASVEAVIAGPRVTHLAGLPERVVGVVRHGAGWLPALRLAQVAAPGEPGPVAGEAGVALVLRRAGVGYALLAESAAEEGQPAPEGGPAAGAAVAVDPERLFRAPLPPSLARDVLLRAEGEALLEVVTFQVAGDAFALPVEMVREVVSATQRSARSGGAFAGHLAAPRAGTPVLDLRRRFERPAGSPSEGERVVVVDTPDGLLGLLVDAMGPVLEVSARDLAPPPGAVVGRGAPFLDAVVRLDDGELVLLLRPDRLLAPGELRAAAGSDG